MATDQGAKLKGVVRINTSKFAAYYSQRVNGKLENKHIGVFDTLEAAGQSRDM